MSMQNIDYEIRDIIVSINGKEYPVAKRNEKTEKALRYRESKLLTSTQYDSDMELVRILLGPDAAKELFPGGEDENLDRLHYIAAQIYDAYMADYRKIEKERQEKQLEQIEALSEKIKPLADLNLDSLSKAKRK